MSISDNLENLENQKIHNRNFVNNFLPFRSKTTGIDFEAVAGSVLAIAYQKRLEKECTLESFKLAISDKLANKLTDQAIQPLIDKMYFCNEAAGLFKVSPEFLIFKAKKAETSTYKHVSQVLISFVGNTGVNFNRLSSDVNFLEKEIIDEFQGHLIETRNEFLEDPYLPFIVQNFSNDLRFLLKHPAYFLQNVRSFFNLYTFLYCSQLALNINEWNETPTSKPLFFILDMEKASLERKQVTEAFSHLKSKVADLFPVLSMVEYLNQPQNKKVKKFPLWKIYSEIENMPEPQKHQFKTSLVNFCVRYRDNRNLETVKVYPEKTDEILKLLSRTAKEIFRRGTEEYSVKNAFVRVFENEIASHFIQVRGRSGRVLTISQDYLLLLINISIGAKEQVQFQELLQEFKKRGVWFDKQSEQAIIRFLERIGNVKRMSDSGDAIYVRKTL